MPSSELADWALFESVEPFGDMRNNIHTGMLLSGFFNWAQGRKRRRTYKPADFLLTDAKEAQQNNLARGIAKLKALSVKAKP